MASTMVPIIGSDEETTFDAFRQGVSVLTMEQQFAGLLPRMSAGTRPKRLKGTMPIVSNELNLNYAFNDLEENKYTANNTLVLWARMNTGPNTVIPSPTDLGPNGISIEYEDAPTITQELLGDGDISYPVAQFLDSGPTSAYAMSSNGLLSFSVTDDWGTPTEYTDTPFTISLWANIDNLTDHQYLFGKRGGVSGTSLEYRGLVRDDGKIQFRLEDEFASTPNKQEIESSNSAIVPGEWNHITFTYDGRGGPAASDGMKIYLNGVSHPTDINLAQANYLGMQRFDAGPLYIGQRESGTQEIDARMAEFAVWDSELSEQDVLAIYNATKKGPEEYYIRRGGYYPIGSDTLFDDSAIAPVAHLLDPAYTGVGTVNLETGEWSGAASSVPLTDAGESIITVPNHETERRDFGQPKLFKDDEPYEDFGKSSGDKRFSGFNPVLFLLDDHSTLMYPLILANASMKDPDQYDGVIEPFTIKSRASRLSPEAPFFAHDIRASLQSDASECSRLKAVPIVQFIDNEQSAFDYYEDGIENFGAELMIMNEEEKLEGLIGPVYPGYLTQAESVINPFVESSDSEEFHTDLHINEVLPPGLTGFVDPGGMLNALQMMAERTFIRSDGTTGYMSSHSHDDLLPHHHKSSGAGFTYENNKLGTDSIAFGGFLK